jgi:hypothetical protein
MTTSGELDLGSARRMETLRREIILSKPKDDLDRLMQLGAIRSVASYMLTAFDEMTDEIPESLMLFRDGIAEILLGIAALRPKLEKDAGQTIDELGLFVDGGALQ